MAGQQQKPIGRSSPGVKVAVVAVLVVAVGLVLYFKRDRHEPDIGGSASGRPAPNGAPVKQEESGTGNAGPTRLAPDDPNTTTKLPRLLDLGAGKCIPCKMMAPILEQLKKEHAGRFTVDFIDVWMDPEAKEKHGIRMIPTQIFYASDGKELFRHEGFYSKEDILKKWKELGFEFPAAKTSVTSPGG